MVREPLVWLGCDDPVATMQELCAEDPRGVERHAVFDVWKSATSFNSDGKSKLLATKEVIEVANNNLELRAALLAIDAARPKWYLERINTGGR